MSQLSRPKEYHPAHLVQSLKKRGPDLLKQFFRPRQPDLQLLVKSSVGANTFRAFHNLREKPSVIFRRWAFEYLDRTLEKLCRITTQSQYDQFHIATRNDLEKRWRQEGGKPLKLGWATKLTNLLLKEAMKCSDIPDSSRQTLIPLLHVPHDLYCLAAIRESARTGTPCLKIPAGAKMGFIKSPTQYQQLQEIMRNIASQAKQPPICIDLLAWNDAH